MRRSPRPETPASDAAHNKSSKTAQSTNLFKATMNRFLTRKKKDDGEDGPVPSSNTRKWGRARKDVSEPQAQEAPSIALPDTDNFRTSLIMPGLSARFSMLREQDDPTSKLGKASDDSVLQPKRQSRLMEFGFTAGGLSDIAEVASINSSIRPPFAMERTGSFDGYGSDGESSPASIMSRARPGEGNVLFGGRQKIYKIPVSNSGSSKSLGGTSTPGMGGRTLYDDDVSQSTFQKYRQEQQRKEMEAQAEAAMEADADRATKGLSQSPSVSGSSQRRGTTSSTTSAPGNARASTAATSIASQGPNAVTPAATTAIAPAAATPAPTLERSTTKARRLYEQGLDQHMHEQQSSALTRLNSIQRQRPMNGAPYLPLARSASNLHDRFNRPSQPFRAASPPPVASYNSLNNFGTLREDSDDNATPSPLYSQSPPLSPLGSDEDNHPLTSALRPGDRGKATAMGAFNRPKQKFDEQQYLQRQMQLMQGRETPPLRRDTPPQHAQENGSTASTERKQSDAVSEDSPPHSRQQAQKPSPFLVFQNAAAQIRDPRSNEPTPKPQVEAQKTFFMSPEGSDSDEEPAPPARDVMSRPLGTRPPLAASHTAPPMLEHPALRPINPAENGSTSSYQNQPKDSLSPTEAVSAERQASVGTLAKSDGTDIDSPTLGPDNAGLSGLVRAHLRQASNVSSEYDDVASINPSIRVPGEQFHPALRTSENVTPVDSTYTHSNPWDLEDFNDGYYAEEDSLNSASPVDAAKTKRSMPQPSSLGREHMQQNHRMNGAREDVAPWEQEMRTKHNRGASTETQQERDAFANELAQRQKAIQERVRSRVDAQSRSDSPGPGEQSRLKVLGGMLRSKSSRESVASKYAEPPQRQQEPPSKAMRMLGLGGPSANASTSSLKDAGERQHQNDWWSREEDRIGNDNAPPTTLRMAAMRAPSRADGHREDSQYSRKPSEDSNREYGNMRRSPPESMGGSTRGRSSSEVSSSRSRSRTGRYRDDPEKAMAEGTALSRSNEVSPQIPQGYMRPSPPETASPLSTTESFASGRLRSNSKSTGQGYFDQRNLRPIQTGIPGLPAGPSPHLSPAVNGQAHALSPGLSPRPSPGIQSNAALSPRPPMSSPYSQTPTPPISAATTPVASSFTGERAPSRTTTTRKRSIQKSEISEPKFISSTSVVDTVDLPEGASLKNGMEGPPPPLPPINPRRRRFGFGKNESPDRSQTPEPSYSVRSGAMSPPVPAERTFSADEQAGGPPRATRHKLRKSSSEGHSLRQEGQFELGNSSTTVSSGYGGPVQKQSPPRHRPIIAEGAMF